MLFAPSVCKGGLRSHFNLISDGREPAREVAGKIAERHGGIMAAEFENYWRSLGKWISEASSKACVHKQAYPLSLTSKAFLAPLQTGEEPFRGGGHGSPQMTDEKSPENA